MKLALFVVTLGLGMLAAVRVLRRQERDEASTRRAFEWLADDGHIKPPRVIYPMSDGREKYTPWQIRKHQSEALRRRA